MESTTPSSILLVEDDPDFGESLERWLQTRGFACELQTNVAGAKKALDFKEFDLLISDIYLPDDLGMSLAEHIARQPLSVPVVLLTGSPSMESAIQSVSLPVVGYLTKPLDTEAFLELVESQIKRHQQMRTARNRLATLKSRLESLRDRLARGDSYGTLAAEFEDLCNHVDESRQLLEEAAKQTLSEYHAAQMERFKEALLETVSVLESTRRQFKSKEIGRLRRRLERLLESP